MNSQQITLDVHPDVADELTVFLYTNLSKIISPTPSVLLTPQFQAGLQAVLNDVGILHNAALPKDLKDILDVFVITNINTIAVDTTP